MATRGIIRRALIPALDRIIKLETHGFPKANLRSGAKKFTLVRVGLAEDRLGMIAKSLNRHLYPCLRIAFFPIPADLTRKMRKNYTEALPKTFRFKTALIGPRASQARRVSAALGITAVLQSRQLRLLGERITGKRLNEDPACQIICYEAGDFCGPHNVTTLNRPNYVMVMSTFTSCCLNPPSSLNS